MEFYRYGFYKRLNKIQREGDIILPTTEELYEQIIKILKESGPLTLGEIRRRLALYYWLSEEEVFYTSEFGSRPVFAGRVDAAIRKLVNLFIIDRIDKGVYELSEFGEELLTRRYPFTEDGLKQIRRLLEEEYGLEYDNLWNLKSEVIPCILIEDPPELERFLPHEEWFEDCKKLTFEDIEGLYNSDIRFRKIVETGIVKYKEDGLYLAVPVWHKDEERFEWYVKDEDPGAKFSIKRRPSSGMLCFLGLETDPDFTPETYLEYLKRIYKDIPGWFGEDYESMSEIYRLLLELESEPDPHKALKRFLKKLKTTQENMSGVLEIDERTIRRYLNNETPMKLEVLVKICVALKLPRDFCLEIIKKFNVPDGHGYTFEPTYIKEHRFWDWLFKYGQLMSPKKINELAKKWGFEEIF